MLWAALSPVLAVAFVALAAMGWTSVTFLATGNTTLQLEAAPTMRGRVMALWAVAFMGSTPVGGPLIGWVVALAGARIGLGVGAMSAFLAAAIGLLFVVKLGMLHERKDSDARRSDGGGGLRAGVDGASEGVEVPGVAV
jgi:MFS family permease